MTEREELIIQAIWGTSKRTKATASSSEAIVQRLKLNSRTHKKKSGIS